MGCGTSKKTPVVETNPKETNDAQPELVKPVSSAEAPTKREKVDQNTKTASEAKVPSKIDLSIIDATQIDKKAEVDSMDVDDFHTPGTVHSTKEKPESFSEDKDTMRFLSPKPSLESATSLEPPKSTNLEERPLKMTSATKARLQAQQEQASQNKLPSLTTEKLPAISKPEAFVVEIEARSAKKRQSNVQVRLEKEKNQAQQKRPTTAAQIERKQQQAEERRRKHQGEIVKKAQTESSIVEQRKEKVKSLEQQREEQLKKIMVEKKRLVEQNKLLKEQEHRRKLEEDNKHITEVVEKAKKRKSDDPNDSLCVSTHTSKNPSPVGSKNPTPRPLSKTGTPLASMHGTPTGSPRSLGVPRSASTISLNDQPIPTLMTKQPTDPLMKQPTDTLGIKSRDPSPRLPVPASPKVAVQPAPEPMQVDAL